MKDILANLDKAFESRIRLGIMSVLMINDSADFITLRELIDVSDGNLASHLRTLEEAGYISIEKRFINKKPNTSYSATPKGSEAFRNHLANLEKLIYRQ
ncbi:MAG: transcriptional regulator [Bacteroidetes bacterium]|nr:transcriptional regulator [Bacteroidota bacterium]